jgi:hypothetical protein
MVASRRSILAIPHLYNGACMDMDGFGVFFIGGSG